jgi:hypothetical protein
VVAVTAFPVADPAAEGAVNNPVELIVPLVVDQVTPDMEAENCFVAPARTEGVPGLMRRAGEVAAVMTTGKTRSVIRLKRGIVVDA